jgi:hypothetical protein
LFPPLPRALTADPWTPSLRRATPAVWRPTTAEKRDWRSRHTATDWRQIASRDVTTGTNRHNMTYSMITFDQAIYFKAKEIQWLSEECSHFIIRLGGFHIILNFLKVTGQHMSNSGLNDVWSESNVYGEATVVGIMNG